MANRHHTYRLLQCLTGACRPLRVEELAEILALDFDETKEGIPELKADWRWKDQQEAVLSTCSSLVSVVDDGPYRVVQFSHFSVKEFLTSNRLATSTTDISRFHILPEPAHTVIVKACLGILLQSANGVGEAKVKSSSPLAKYAAEHWVDHAKFEKVSKSVEDGMRHLFDLEKPHFAGWLRLYDIDTRWVDFVDPNKNIARGSPLYYASLCGFRDLAAHLAGEHPQQVKARVGQNGSPLAAALRNQHFHTAELLYQRGANVGIRGNFNCTLLHAAAADGFVDTGQWLLAHGGDANSREVDGETPLHWAARMGRTEFVRMLLSHIVIIDAKNKNNRTSLHLASSGGHVEIVRLLLQHGADVATRDLNHETALHLVSSMRFPEIARLLIEHGADLGAPDKNGKTPLHRALFEVSIKTARLLLQHGADMKEQSTHFSFDEAYDERTAETVQVLLEHGADVTARDHSHSTPFPFHLAFSMTNPKIARLLIEHSVGVTTRDGTHSTLLHLASSEGTPIIVRLLIEHGADVTALDGNHKTPLHLASSGVSVKTARLLLPHSTDVSKRTTTTPTTTCHTMKSLI